MNGASPPRKRVPPRGRGPSTPRPLAGLRPARGHGGPRAPNSCGTYCGPTARPPRIGSGAGPRGPGGTRPPPGPPLRSLRSLRTSCGVRPAGPGFVPRLFGPAFSAARRPALARSLCSRAASGSGLAARRLFPPSRLRPGLRRLGALCPRFAAGSGPCAWPPCASAVPSLRCGLPVRSPLLRLGLPLRSVRLAPSSRRAPFGAVGAGLVALLLGGGSGPGAVGGPAGRLFRPSAPGPFLLGLPPCASGACPAVLRWSVGSPLRPSRPRRPRWGLRGALVPVGGACGPPPWVLLFAALPGGSPGA